MEAMIRHSSYDTQKEIIRQHCREAEADVIRASNHAEALRIREKWCRQLRMKCESPLVVSGVTAYLDGIIDRRWKRGEGSLQ
jgi:hypothetical protein